jgi:uncharacterized cupredoxin-like copper-binding protein
VPSLEEGVDMKVQTSRRAIGASLIGVLAMVGTACGGGGSSVDATLSDFKIELSKNSGDAGEVTFKIKNNGPSTHEFVVFRTDIPEGQIPTTEENGVKIIDEENAQGLELVDEAEDIQANISTELKLDLAAGHYVIVCNVPAHYAAGMHADFTSS